MTLPIITIVTPSYNQSAYLEATIRSVLDQNYPALRYIIMDGGSTDGSVDIIKRYADKLTYWVSEKDGGQSDAINKGFAYFFPANNPNNEIMTWLNSDDVLLPDALKRVGQIFEQYPEIQWLTGQPANMDANGGHLKLGRLKTGHGRDLIRRGWYHGRGLGFIRQEGTFWRRTLWNEVGGINPNLHYAMDFDLWRRFAAHAPLVTVDQHLAVFRTQPQQKTSAIEKYYAEAGVTLPNSARLIALPPSWAFHRCDMASDAARVGSRGCELSTNRVYRWSQDRSHPFTEKIPWRFWRKCCQLHPDIWQNWRLSSDCSAKSVAILVVGLPPPSLPIFKH